MTQFTELTISSQLQERLSAARFIDMTPVQAAALPHALAGKDVLATAQTGTGKTLAFLIPVMEQLLQQNTPGIMALVLVPTRELAMQVAAQYDALRGGKLPAAALVVGGLPEGKQLHDIRRGARLMVATPGRLEDFLDRKLVSFTNLTTLVLDEADRMLDMGFLPAIKRIVGVLPVKRQTLCFSATLPDSVGKLVSSYMKTPARVALGAKLKPSENVRIQAFEVINDRKQDALHKLLDGESGRCLVFARTKRGTERLAKRLTQEGFAAAMIHGDRTQGQRTAALTAFQQGRVRVLVATDLASRGIHVQDIAHVINYDLPAVAEDFVHRVGRTGRAGGQGVASTLFGKEQRGDLFQLEKALGLKMERKQMELVAATTSARAERQPEMQVELDPTPTPRSFKGRRNGRAAGRSSYASGGRSYQARDESGVQPQMVRLPGETFQMQLEPA